MLGLLTALALLVALLALPSLAQESKSPTSKDATTATTGLHEGGGQSPAVAPQEGSSVARQDGGRIENLSAGLMLESARIESANIHDTDQEYAVYRFGRVIHDVKNVGGFTVSGFDVERRAMAADARLVDGDPTSVVVGFPHGTDLRGYRLASVALGSVIDEVGRGNEPGSVPLDGSSEASTGKLTAAPDLVSIRTIDALNRVVYSYDEQLDEKAGGDAAKFGYFTADGKAVPAKSIVTAVDNTITVAFDRRTDDGVLFYADEGAVKNLRGRPGTTGAIGTATSAPNLASVSDLIGRSQFDFTFDKPVTDVMPDKFVVYAVDGTPYRATSFARPSAEVVRIAIPQIRDYGAKMALAAVEGGAVKANDGSGVANTIGSRHIGSQSPAAAVSSGPYLTSVSLDQAAGQVRFVFDKPVNDDLTYEAKNFMLMTPAGDLVHARSVVEVNGNTVLLNFDKNVVSAARGVSLAEGAVKDFQGDTSPARTLGI
jgi:hypothetical protein